MTFNRPTASAASERGECQQLLTATASLLLSRGYAATSIGRICLRADTTPGRFAAHLGRKSDAAHAVAAHLTRRAVDRINRFTPRDAEHLLATLTTWTRLLTTRPGWIWLELDLADLDPPSRAEVYARADRLRRALTNLLARSPWLDVSDRGDSEREQLVSLLVTLVLGTAIQHSHGTTFTTETVYSHLALALGTNRRDSP
ncbi:hypothetical protein ABZV58_28990 [Nocardia sp. NPDC004654]|uniref:hypothetical protein n=1 Tax=Nocardia sp. NPDC004654 TaxID=3154776 RepID=UPI0033B8438E